MDWLTYSELYRLCKNIIEEYTDCTVVTIRNFDQAQYSHKDFVIADFEDANKNYLFSEELIKEIAKLIVKYYEKGVNDAEIKSIKSI